MLVFSISVNIGKGRYVLFHYFHLAITELFLQLIQKKSNIATYLCGFILALLQFSLGLF